MAPRKPKVTLATTASASSTPSDGALGTVMAEPSTQTAKVPAADTADKKGNGLAHHGAETASSTRSHAGAPKAPASASSKPTDFADVLRHLAEQGMEQTRVAYETLKTVSTDASGSLAASRQAASSGLLALNSAAIDALKANTASAFALVTSLMAAKDMSEAVKLQAEHVRRQVEVVNAQAKDLAALAQKVATESAEPLKATLSKVASAKSDGTVH